MPLGELMRRRIFVPLELGAGGLWSTLHDLGRLVAFELAAYAPATGPETLPARRSSVRESHFNARRGSFTVEARPGAQKGESIVSASAGSGGYGWTVWQTCDYEKLVAKGGASSGSSGAVFMLPDHGVGIVVLRNVSIDDVSDVEDLARSTLLALKQTGGLGVRMPSWPLAPFDAVMPKILALYDRWDDGGYRALMSSRQFLTLSAVNEREVLASLKRIHGACTGYAPKETLSPTAARFALACQRGTLELLVHIDPVDGLLNHHLEARSRDVLAAELGKMADRLADLVGAWDDAVYASHLAAKGRRTREEAAAIFAALRAGHGSCKVTSHEHWSDSEDRSTGLGSWSEGDAFTLGCERGGDVRLDLRLDPVDAESVIRYELRTSSSGTCPTW